MRKPRLPGFYQLCALFNIFACRQGEYLKDNDICLTCPIGTYNSIDINVASMCKPCLQDYITKNNGSISVTQCIRE